MARAGGAPLPTITDDRALGAADIQRSLRFNDDDSAYLNRTPSSASNRKTFTVSWWFKIVNLGTFRVFFGAYDNSTSGNDGYYFSCALGSDNKLYFGAWTQNWRITNRLFRDPSAWYHCVLAVDTTQSTAADRIKIYVNGVEETSFGTSNNPSQNLDLGWNFNSQMQTIGRVNYTSGSGPYPFDGYMTEFNSIDGYAYDASYFGFTDPQTSIWMPKRYEGTYGTNGFYLDFSDNSSTAALGIDKSPNGNDFTTNNFSVSAWPDNDSVIDTPTNNFNTFNSNDRNSNAVLANGGLQTAATATGGHYPAFTTTAIKSGKWYLEWKYLTNDSGLPSIMDFVKIIGAISGLPQGP